MCVGEIVEDAIQSAFSAAGSSGSATHTRGHFWRLRPRRSSREPTHQEPPCWRLDAAVVFRTAGASQDNLAVSAHLCPRVLAIS
jgi:hypothetical protein